MKILIKSSIISIRDKVLKAELVKSNKESERVSHYQVVTATNFSQVVSLRGYLDYDGEWRQKRLIGRIFELVLKFLPMY